MSSPVGHAIAGLAVAWGADLVPGDRKWRTAPASASWYARAGGTLTVVCAGLAASPDLDLLFHAHRTFTHSVLAAVVAGLVAGLVALRAGRPVVRVASMCAAAYGSHLLLDWIAADPAAMPGLQLLWPWHHWFLSGWDLLPPAQRQDFLSFATIRLNTITLLREIATLAPIACLAWWARTRMFARYGADRSGRGL
jgi:membrane-bound metal-dependent hydrolase YbcI (DUF457 family)